MNSVMKALNGKMTIPTIFSWFHLMMLAIIIAVTAFLCIKFRKADDKKLRIILLVLSLICIVFEIYKQLNFSYNDGNWAYQWYVFPFQFCSTPIYIAFIASLLKPSKFRDCLFAFLATFGLFAGLSVVLYPSGVFTSTIGINIQTMVHHGTQVIIGVFLIAASKVKLGYRTILKGLPVFLTLLLIALIMNIAFYLSGNPATFNMFFISPYYDCTLPILGSIYGAVFYPIFLLIYILSFTCAAYIVLLLSKLISMIFVRKN